MVQGVAISLRSALARTLCSGHLDTEVIDSIPGIHWGCIHANLSVIFLIGLPITYFINYLKKCLGIGLQ